MKTRFATKPLATGGNWSQGTSKKAAFHRDTGVTVPYCQNAVCAKGLARHWHGDCPNGGRNGLLAYSFTSEEADNSVLAARFQQAIDHDNAEEFDALCVPVRPTRTPVMPPPVTRTFADFINNAGFTVEAPDPEPYVHMNMLSAAVQHESGDGYATGDTGDEDVAPQQPPARIGCGVPVAGFGRSFLTSSLVCALFIIRNANDTTACRLSDRVGTA
ncbi:hypothetical protein CYMTET_43802 [Cymbomonas tetramitiformis]|uniref:Uncharacterized protein n=1 Tax=Cymbomonas tetramitiformis TaxID=36881 RepID=A0AAE0C2N5_9CHLO|nr:hypothetical protein CYMTET_43802 [Cymbomonas tetramitiformis]